VQVGKFRFSEKPVAVFDFKNAAAVVTGTVNKARTVTHVENGTLEGKSLKFETMEPAGGAEEVLKIAWRGTVAGWQIDPNNLCSSQRRGQRWSSEGSNRTHGSAKSGIKLLSHQQRRFHF
jgi:hypothetical protein